MCCKFLRSAPRPRSISARAMECSSARASSGLDEMACSALRYSRSACGGVCGSRSESGALLLLQLPHPRHMAMCMVPLWSADRSERIQYISSEVSSSADSPRIRCMSSDERFPLFSQQWGAGVTSDAVPPRPGMDRSTESVQSCRMSGAVRSCHLAPFLAGHFREQGRAPPRARCHCAAHCRTRSQVCPCPSGALGGASLGPIAPCAGTEPLALPSEG